MMDSFIWIAGLVGWVCFIAGFCLIGTRLDTAKKLKKSLWNGRIDKLGKLPFSLFLRVYEEKRYWKSFLMVLVCNLPGHIAMFLFGFIKVGIVMIAIQPFMQGAVVGMGDKKTRVYGCITAIFEVSGFILSCCFGFFGAVSLWWVSAVFLLFNALVEAGGVLAGVQGVPGSQAVQNKEYLA